jgi:hypothetical protein
LPVPVIGNGGDDAIDIFVVEQLLIAPRHGEIGSHDFARQHVPAIV